LTVVDDEEALVRAAFGGDNDAFGELVGRYQRPVYNLCCRHRPQEAADLAQEAFLRAFVNRHLFSPDRRVLPWLLTVARHLCIDAGRRHREIPSDNTLPVVDPAPDPEHRLIARQRADRARLAIAALPDTWREALVLCHVEGLSYRETADVLGVPQGTVMTWIHRGRNALRETMEEGDAHD